MKNTLVVVAAVVACMGCATVKDVNGPVFGRAPVEKTAECKVEVVRAVDASRVQQLSTRLVDGSVFLSQGDVERILSAEACAVGADVVLISSEVYGVPFVGSYAIGTLYRRI
jgi:hypothetical protein